MRMSNKILGRDGELAALATLVEGVSEGQGAVALVQGEAGVGRTRLTRETMVRARRSCAVAWSGAGTAPPGQSVGVSLIAQLADGTPRVPGRPAVPTADGDTEASRRQVTDVLRTAASAGPVALFVDDVHLADRSTCLLLDVLLRLTAEVPLLLVVTAMQESGTDTREPRAWHFLTARPEVRTITLGRLTDEAITEMLRLSLPTADAQLVGRMTNAARGNPRLATSMAWWSGQGGEPLMADLPTDELVRGRVTDCEHDGALAALALFARPVSAELLARATGHTDAVVSWVLERAEAARVVVRKGGEPGGAPTYELTHPLLGASALAVLDRPRLDRARTAVAHVVADRQHPETAAWTPAEVASLLVAANDVGDRAQDLCLEAALWCEAVEQFDDAFRFASHALRHSHRCPERVALLGVLGRSLMSRDRAGAADALHEAMTLADRLPSPGPYAQAVAEFVGVDVLAAGYDPEHVALLRGALERCPPGQTTTEAALRALLAEAAYALDNGGRNAFAECRTLATRALRLIDESPCTATEKASVRFLAVKFHMAPHGWGTVRKVVDSFRAVSTPHTGVLGLPAATALCLATGSAAELASLETEFGALSGSRDPAARSALDQVRAARALLAGQWDTLTALLPRLQPHWMTRNPEIAQATPAILAAIWRGHTGRPLPPAVERPEYQPLSPWLVDLAALGETTMAGAHGSGSTSPAAEQLSARLAHTPLPPEDGTWSTHLVLRARLAAITGDTVLARRACAELAPFEDQFAVFSWCVPFGPVGWYTAEALLMLGRAGGAYAANRSAEQASRRLGARVWTARCLTQRARLFRAEDPIGAEVAREEALSIAEELDLVGLFLEAQRLAPSGTGECRAPEQTQLSAREREVLRMIGLGLSNSQIATRMGLSVGTVERHCSGIYRKLRVRNRAQALSVAGNTESWPAA